MSRIDGTIMSDVVFKCWMCSKSLAISDKGAGKVIYCPDCSKQLTVPYPKIFYNCPRCNSSLTSPEEYANTVLACPNCDADVTVPEFSEETSQERDVSQPESGVQQ